MIARAGAHAAPMVVRERVRWSDVDAAGIVCYGSFLRFFEVGEGELFRAAGLPHAAVDAEGVWLVRRRVECDFLRPVRLDDELEVHTRVDELGGSSLALAFEIRRGGETAVTGRYVLVSVDRGEMRPVPLPPRIRVALAPVRAVARTGA